MMRHVLRLEHAAVDHALAEEAGQEVLGAAEPGLGVPDVGRVVLVHPALCAFAPTTINKSRNK